MNVKAMDTNLFDLFQSLMSFSMESELENDLIPLIYLSFKQSHQKSKT